MNTTTTTTETLAAIETILRDYCAGRTNASARARIRAAARTGGVASALAAARGIGWQAARGPVAALRDLALRTDEAAVRAAESDAAATP